MQPDIKQTPEYNNEKMVEHIALFIPSLVGGGAEKVFLNLAESFLDRGIRVDLVVAGVFGDLVDQVDPRCRVFNLGKRRVLSAISGLMRYLRAENPPVLLSALTHANLIAIIAKWFAGVQTRLIVTEHLSLQVKASLKHRLLYPLARLLYNSVSYIVAVSDGVADDLRILLNPQTPVVVIHNPINLDRIINLSMMPPDHRWLVEHDLPVLVSVGRLHPNKDFDTLLKAFAGVVSQRPARLIILGKGELRSELEALASSLGISEFVSMPGFVENPYTYMRRADVFVVSSVYEGLPMVLLEALACGVTIVSTDCPSGPAEILNGGEFGFLVPVRDPRALANAVIQALDHPFPAEPNRTRAARFDLSRISERYLDLIQQSLHEERDGRGG